jgi:probable rRNA maturation factor
LDQKIQFFYENTSFRLRSRIKIKAWLLSVIREEKKKPWYINFIYCDDAYLLELNKTYLKRATLTDVISFSYSEDDKTVTGDVFMSIERIGENAEKFKKSLHNEILRVMIHGLLHLMGYEDNSKAKKQAMTQKENYYLKKFTVQIPPGEKEKRSKTITRPLP